MRRSLSILLLLVLALGPAAPGALSMRLGTASGWTGKVDESRLPECCRRNGRHHCEMGSGDASSQSANSRDETTVASSETCPFMPHALASTAPTVVGLAACEASSLALPCELRSAIGPSIPVSASLSRDWPKRGPPATPVL
jgi:hypothetical protein